MGQYEGSYDGIWSVVRGRYVGNDGFKATPIFPFQLGQAVMSHIFGPEADDEINTARNGLVLPGSIKKAFVNHQIVIVPQSAKKPLEWKWMVIDRAGLWNSLASGDLRYSDIHNQGLIFPETATRPRARYFYHHYLMAMFLQGRKDKNGRANVKQGVDDATVPELARVWATQGRYLRDNVIRAFIEGLGHALPDAEDMLVEYINDTIPETPGAVEECLESMEVCSETASEIEFDLERREREVQEERKEWEDEQVDVELEMGQAIEEEVWDCV